MAKRFKSSPLNVAHLARQPSIETRKPSLSRTNLRFPTIDEGDISKRAKEALLDKTADRDCDAPQNRIRRMTASTTAQPRLVPSDMCGQANEIPANTLHSGRDGLVSNEIGIAIISSGDGDITASRRRASRRSSVTVRLSSIGLGERGGHGGRTHRPDIQARGVRAAIVFLVAVSGLFRWIGLAGSDARGLRCDG